MKNSILLLVALEQELPIQLVPHGMKVVYTGIGKINATYETTRAIYDLKPKLVINFGTAGAIGQIDHGIYEVQKVVQRDVITAPLAERGITPFDESPNEYTSGKGNLICATGDSFVTSDDPWFHEMKIDLVDMELFAIAKVCFKFSLPWISAKYVSDSANENAAVDWNENLKSAAKAFISKSGELSRY